MRSSQSLHYMCDLMHAICLVCFYITHDFIVLKICYYSHLNEKTNLKKELSYFCMKVWNIYVLYKLYNCFLASLACLFFPNTPSTFCRISELWFRFVRFNVFSHILYKNVLDSLWACTSDIFYNMFHTIHLICILLPISLIPFLCTQIFMVILCSFCTL